MLLPLIADANCEFCFIAVQSLDQLGPWEGGGDKLSRDSLPVFVFLQEAIVSSSSMGRGVHTLMLSIQHFLHRQRCRPPRCPEGWFGEAVVACDLPKPCKSFSLDSCQKRFLWTHKEVDLAPHSVVSLVLQVGDAEKFPQTFGFESLDPFCQSASRVHVSQP